MRAPVKAILSALLTAGDLLPAQEPPTFTSDTQVVLLDLVARDRKGKPVADLRKDEVRVFEDGTRCDETGYNEGEEVASLAGAPGLDAIVATLAEGVSWLLQRYPERAQDATTQ